MNTKNRITNAGVTYDNAGNVVGDGLYTYVWDAENRLTSANGVTYTYDGDGRRVKKSNGTLYWYDTKGNVLEETDLSGNFPYDYAYFNGQRIGRRDSAGNMLSYFNDVLSTARVIAGPNSTLAESDYYPFGGERVISDTLTPDNRYKFTGMERDTETGLDHTLFRQYTSSLGRWMSPDPVKGDINNPQSFNRYAYVLNKPTSLIDLLGLQGGCNVNNGSWEGSGIPFPCGDASTHTAQPAESPTSIAGPTGVATGSMIGMTGSDVAAGEARFGSIFATGWDPVLGINWNNVPGPQDPGCGPGVVANINATIGQDTGLTFSQFGPGNEVGGNWDYTLLSTQSWGTQEAAQKYADIIASGALNTGLGLGRGTRAGPSLRPMRTVRPWCQIRTVLAMLSKS